MIFHSSQNIAQFLDKMKTALFEGVVCMLTRIYPVHNCSEILSSRRSPLHFLTKFHTPLEGFCGVLGSILYLEVIYMEGRFFFFAVLVVTVAVSTQTPSLLSPQIEPFSFFWSKNFLQCFKANEK